MKKMRQKPKNWKELRANWERILKETDTYVRDKDLHDIVKGKRHKRIITICKPNIYVDEQRNLYRLPSLSHTVQSVQGVSIEDTTLTEAKHRLSSRTGLLYNKGVYGYITDLQIEELKKGK